MIQRSTCVFVCLLCLFILPIVILTNSQSWHSYYISYAIRGTLQYVFTFLTELTIEHLPACKKHGANDKDGSWFVKCMRCPSICWYTSININSCSWIRINVQTYRHMLLNMCTRLNVLNFLVTRRTWILAHKFTYIQQTISFN